MSTYARGAAPGEAGSWRYWFAWYPVKVAPIRCWLDWHRSVRWLTIVRTRPYDSMIIADRVIHRWEYRA